jgi:hypothetical protein
MIVNTLGQMAPKTVHDHDFALFRGDRPRRFSLCRNGLRAFLPVARPFGWLAREMEERPGLLALVGDDQLDEVGR